MTETSDKKEKIVKKGQPVKTAEPVAKTSSEAATPAQPAVTEQKTEAAATKKEEPVQEEVKEAPFDVLRPGDTVRVHQKIKQGDKERIQIFEGVIIAKKGKSDITRTITVRKIASGGFGVEKIFPLASPLIEKIETVNRPRRIRRSKLYYLRESARKIKELREKK